MMKHVGRIMFREKCFGIARLLVLTILSDDSYRILYASIDRVLKAGRESEWLMPKI